MRQPFDSALRHASFCLGSSAATHLFLLVPTLVTLQIFDRVLSGRSANTLVMLLAVAILALIAWCLVEAARSRHQAALAATIDDELTQVLSQRILQAHLHGANADAQRLWQDMATIRSFVSSPLCAAVIDLPWGLIYLLIIFAFHPFLGAVALAGMIVLTALAYLTEVSLRVVVAQSESAQSACSHQVMELASFTEVFQAHGQFRQAEKSLIAIKNEASQYRLIAEQPGHNLKTIGKLLRQVLQLGMLATGAWLVIHNQATGGVMIAGTILLGKALMPLEVLISSWKYLLETRKAYMRLQHALLALARIQATLPNTILPSPLGALQAKHLLVKASGTDAAILHSISFSLPAGSMLAVLGPSGSGKTTLARVLAGALEPTHGELAIDGAAMHQYTDMVRGPATGYLPQDVQLHSGSIAHNIARLWGSDQALSEDDNAQVITAAKLAGAHELITSLSKGYDTHLGPGPGAHTLSGGQRQRIALARAVFGNPSLIVLDEPNSQLDTEGEAALERCLRALRERGATVIAVTHRPHLIELSSHVMVLREGKVEQFGLREQVRQWMLQRNPHAMKNKDTQADKPNARNIKSIKNLQTSPIDEAA